MQTARLVAREGRVTLQALAGPRPQSPDWERAGVVETDAYLAVLDRLLRDPALAGDWPAPRFDATAPGPRRAIVVQLAIGEDERELQALAGLPYERLAALAGAAPGILPLRAAPHGPLIRWPAPSTWWRPRWAISRTSRCARSAS